MTKHELVGALRKTAELLTKLSEENQELRQKIASMEEASKIEDFEIKSASAAPNIVAREEATKTASGWIESLGEPAVPQMTDPVQTLIDMIFEKGGN